MLNFGDQNYFTRVFPIFEGAQQSPEILDRLRTVGYLNEQPSKKEVKRAAKEQKKAPYYKVDFYPESGNLVSGVTSKVAFQITNCNGERVDGIECTIYDDNRQKITTSVSTHGGIGLFEITPDIDSRYYLNIEGYYERVNMPDTPGANSRYYLNSDGDYERAAMSDILIIWKGGKIECDLPEIDQDGCVVSVDCLSDADDIIIDATSTYSEPVGMVVIGREGVAATEEFTRKKQLSINKKSLCEGVNQVVLYNNQGRELASRLFFIRNGKQPQLTITPSKAGESKPHARQEVTFKVADGQGKGIATDFSLAIYDDATAEGTPQQSIYTSLLLSSELRGYIPNADYYFDADDSERTENLDLIMMVHGWSRYKWDEMSGATPTEILYPYEKKLSVYGRVYLQEWASMPHISQNRAGQGMRFVFKDHKYPTTNIIPYDSSFMITHSVTTLSKRTFSNYTREIKDNLFEYSYSDFREDLVVEIGIKNRKFIEDGKDMRMIFITDSEYRPDERLYTLSEQLLNRAVESKKMSHFPAITLNFYNRGEYSSHFRHKPILESVTNTTYTSLERLLRYIRIIK
ncbi:MAG: hypothetical protein SNH63_01055 [Rikenellaceae bacterium]